jgi:hypothetical protein
MSNSNVPGKQPSTWSQYESGGRADSTGSLGSLGSRIQWDDTVSQGHQDAASRTSSQSHNGEDDDRLNVLRRRRSIQWNTHLKLELMCIDPPSI